MKKRIRFFLACMLLSFTLVTPAQADVASNIPKDVQNYALTKGIEYMGNAATHDPKEYGFDSRDAAKHVTVGPGFQVCYLDHVKLDNASSPSLLTATTPTLTWEFVVNVDGQPHSFITVQKVNGTLQFDQFGGNAHDFTVALQTLNNTAKQKGVNDFHPILIKDRTIRFLVTNLGPQAEELAVPDLPESRADALQTMNYKSAYPSTQIASALQQRDLTEANNPSPDGALLVAGSAPVDTTQANTTRGSIQKGATMLIYVGVIAVITLFLIYRRKKQ